MRFHVVSLPHTQTTKAYSSCAYTEKVRKFCNMMASLGHEVILYASEDNEAKVTELATCITKKEQKKFGFGGPEDYLKIDFNDPKLWGLFNKAVIEKMAERIKPKDFICVITGTPAQPIKNAFLDVITVEFGIGYTGIMNPSYRVFESHAWRNYVYGKYNMDGAFYDEVIPNYFEVEDFPFSNKKDDYFLYIGRLTGKKGYQIAVDVCKNLGKRLIVAGQGDVPDYGEYVGMVGPKERGRLMSKAQAVFVPTLYVGPFEGVSIEANLCGTPVITTDWGVFTETIVDGVNGFRCKNMADFIEATDSVQHLDYKKIRDDAISKYSLDAVGLKYEDYFHRLLTLWGDGFYSE